MNCVYGVFKEGVYRHECMGVFDTAYEAREAARRAHIGDEDTYHGYDVVRIYINQFKAPEVMCFQIPPGTERPSLGILYGEKDIMDAVYGDKDGPCNPAGAVI